jgi:ATP-dependent DNA ligase
VKANARKLPSFIEPIKALPVEKLSEADWLYEIKFDGHRALAFKDGKNVRLVSRNKKAFDDPQLIDALKGLRAERVVIDGEIAVLDDTADLRSSCFRFIRAPSNACRWFITCSICFS